jgi:MFS family permease
VYRIGESDRDILGRPRWLMVLLPWLSMMAVGVAEFAFGSAEKTLSEAHGWSSTNTFWLLSIWVAFQAGVGFPAGRLREKGLFPARAAMLTGAAFAALGYLALSYAPSIGWAFVGFGVLGGMGSGLVYATSVNIVGKWYPERHGGKTGLVSGGFAYGSVPWVFVFIYAFDASNFRWVLDGIGLYVLLVCGVSGLFFKDPPKNWWPAHIDPVVFARGSGKGAGALTKNPPAVRQYGPMEAIRTGMLPLMWLCLAVVAGVSIFGISFQVSFAKQMGFGPLVVAASMGVMSIVNGFGRGLMGWVSDRLGRKQTITLVIAAEGLAQFGVLWAGDAHNQPLFLLFAFVSGLGGGAFFPLFASLVPDYFGVNNNAQNYGLVYSAKLVSGLAGGLGAAVIHAWGYNGAYTLAGWLGLASAAMTLLLRQPGRRSDGE